MSSSLNGTGVTFSDSSTQASGKQAVKAWGNFNGTSSPATRATYNMSSFTRISAGKYSVAFVNAMADTNYVVNISISPDQSGSVSANYQCIGLFTNNFSTLTAPTTTGFTFSTNWSGSGTAEPTYICVTVTGN